MSFALSIVVPTHGRSHLVAQLLESVASDASAAKADVEILLIDDSPPADAAEIGRLAERHGAVLVAATTASVGGKRNLGVSRARHPQVLFLDSDVKIRPGTLRAHHARLSAAPPDVAGCLGKVVFEGVETLAWRVMQAMQLTLPFAYPDHFDTVPWGPTANLSVRRDAFQAIGGFDTSLTRYGGEDVDLGLRWHQAGRVVVTAPEAVAVHAIETWATWRANFRRLWSFGIADYQLLVRHPGRGFVDFPTAPMLWIAQLALVLLLLSRGSIPPGTALAAALMPIPAYLAAYAANKRRPDEAWLVHLLGPSIFFTMDLAKAVEALRDGQPRAILRRLLFLDDLIAQDWREIAANAWGLSAAAISYAAILLLGVRP